jgi:iron complex outermembrane recepter protein
MFRRTKVCTGLMLAFGGSLALGSLPALAQQQMDKVEITGSAIKRIDAETALPVTVITREEIARSGAANMEQLVQKMASTNTAGASRGSDLAGLASYGTSSVSLRGLGDSRTLVLLNGRRLAVFASDGGAVNINAIPLAAIERVEILRDGASAVYGSDAVAGVINFILKQDYNGLEIGGESGRPTKSGGGKTNRANILFGHGDLVQDKYNFMLGLDVEKTTTLYAIDRDFSKSGNRYPYFQNGATPSGRIEGNYDPNLSLDDNKTPGTNGGLNISGSGYGNPYADLGQCADIRMFAVTSATAKYKNCNYDSAADVGLFPETKRTNVFGTFKLALTPEHTLYGEAMFAKNVVTEAYQPAPARSAFFETDNLFFKNANPALNTPAALLVYPGTPAYGIIQKYVTDNATAHPELGALISSGLPVAVSWRAFAAGLRTEEDTLKQSRFLTGLKGSLGSWDYDVAAMYNQSKTEGRLTDGYFSQVGVAGIINSPTSGWNPWALNGQQDAALTSAIQGANYVGPTLTGKSTQASIDATGSTTLTQLAGGPMQLAVGASFRRETYKIDVPPILGEGDIAGLGGATPNEDEVRKAAALYTELNMPIRKDLEVNASGRWDKYSVVGTTTNGKLSTRYTPAKELLLRGAIGTGFRAPTLPELYKPMTVGVSEQFVDPLHPGDGQIQANAMNGGNPNLKPEKSKQLSLGFVVSPTKNYSFGVDYFLIKIDDYIISPAALALVNGVRAGTPLYGPDDATFNADGTVDTVDQRLHNAASALLRGFDVTGNWNDTFSFGKVSVDLTGTYMQTFDLKTLAGTQHSVGTIIQDDGSPLDVASTGVVARWKHNLSATWATGAWATTLAQNYYSGYRDANDLEGNEHRVPGTSTYDAQIAFTGVKNLKVALGAKNLFDKDPPLFIGNGSSFQYGFDPTMSDPRGRFIYVNATYRFF